jgi:tetratricopeptide (TPR) repeat protein
MTQLFPQEMTGFVNRASIYANARKFEQAIDDFTAAINVAPESAYCYFHRGLAKIELTRVDEGIADLTRALELDPKPQGFIKRGEVYFSLEKLDLALADFSKALEVDPEQRTARFRRGAVLQAMGRDQEALADYTQLIDDGVKPAELFHRRGLVFRKLKDWSAAKADYEMAVQVDPDEPVAAND